VGLRDRVHTVLAALRTLDAPRPFVPGEIDRSFLVIASDYVLGICGGIVDRILHAEARGLVLRFLPNSGDDALQLQSAADLAIGIYGELPQETRSRQLLTDRFVCALRRGHPAVERRLTLARYLELDHVQIAPRGRPGGYIDDELRARGASRRIVRAVPYFANALALVAETDYIVTIGERIARQLGPVYGLDVVEPPIALRPYALSLVWHPRIDADPAHRYLRDVFVRAARELGSAHADPLTRLSRTAPGRRRKLQRMKQ
jgi:DNA-binding transcriptional LysR family regulator